MTETLLAPTAPARRARRPVVRIIGAMLVALLAFQVFTWPEVGALAERNPVSSAFIDRARATGRVSWTWVPLEAIAPDLALAVLAAEDTRFFEHEGFDRHEIRAALGQAVRARTTPRGASTITQQLARNLWLSTSRDPIRKAKEAILTMQLERALSKRRILELYLNVAQFGPSVFGAEAAARHAFGKPASALTADEAARLAAVLPAPAAWHPASTSQRYLARVGAIAERMHAAHLRASLARSR